jgi:hypothetical protein
MEQYISKSAVLTVIENLLDKSKYHDKYDYAYRDGNNSALYTLKEYIDTLEVKEVDLSREAKHESSHEELTEWFNNYYIRGGGKDE